MLTVVLPRGFVKETHYAIGMPIDNKGEHTYINHSEDFCIFACQYLLILPGNLPIDKGRKQAQVECIDGCKYVDFAPVECTDKKSSKETFLHFQ